MERYETDIREPREFKGNAIKDLNLAKVLINLNNGGKTGILTVRTPSYRKKIYLDKGNVIFASSTCEDDRLGEMLVKSGRINAEFVSNVYLVNNKIVIQCSMRDITERKQAGEALRNAR